MPEVSDEYKAFMASAAVVPPVTPDLGADDWRLGPIIPDYVFEGDPLRGILPDPRFGAYRNIELTRLEHCGLYYAGAGPEDPNWPRPRVNLKPERAGETWGWDQPPPPASRFWRAVNWYRRRRAALIDPLRAWRERNGWVPVYVKSGHRP